MEKRPKEATDEPFATWDSDPGAGIGNLLMRRQERFGGAKSGSAESNSGRDAKGKADVRGNAKRGGEPGKEDAGTEGRAEEVRSTFSAIGLNGWNDLNDRNIHSLARSGDWLDFKNHALHAGRGVAQCKDVPAKFVIRYLGCRTGKAFALGV